MEKVNVLIEIDRKVYDELKQLSKQNYISVRGMMSLFITSKLNDIKEGNLLDIHSKNNK